MIPSQGRIVAYILSVTDAAEINRRRDDARAKLEWHRENKTGSVVHSGNPVAAGDIYPMVITKVWGSPATEGTSVNGQLLLDGNDTLWVTSRTQGNGQFHWTEFPRV
jgi:hypothetical protein